ncbi:ankyrin, partial [Wallemia mellicola CBS 633.66]
LSHGADVNVKDRANQHPLHRAATIGNNNLVKLLINPDDGKERAKTRLNTSDRIGNTPLHLAIESGHAATAVLLIEAGADRERQNYDQQTPEEIEGVGGQEHRRLLEYIKNACGPRT